MYKNNRNWIKGLKVATYLAGNETETEAWIRISDISGVYVVDGKTFAILNSGREFQINARVEDVIDSEF
jgi:hypothetical protein